MKQILYTVILSTLILTVIACHPKIQSQLSEVTQQFTQVQQSMIMDQDDTSPMRVYQITNRQDSLLLRSKSLPVRVDSTDVTLKRFINRLYSTVRDSMSMGVGIAAPQVGILKQIIWVQRFDKEAFPFEYYLNPRITHYSDLKQDCREGCLSIPDRSDTTRIRAQTIVMQHQLMDGNFVTDTIDGFTAVIFQHEIDHLHGILYLDHLEEEMKEGK